jgi:hypothetical protein
MMNFIDRFDGRNLIRCVWCAGHEQTGNGSGYLVM